MIVGEVVLALLCEGACVGEALVCCSSCLRFTASGLFVGRVEVGVAKTDEHIYNGHTTVGKDSHCCMFMITNDCVTCMIMANGC